MVVPTRLNHLVKVFGNTEPPEIQAAEEAAGMTPSRPFSPGEPIGPYDGFSRNPRTREITTGYNISARPRTHERVPFATLRGLIDAYDVAQMAIWHRIDSIRSLEWSLVAMNGYEGDVNNAVRLGMYVLERPDRDNESEFPTWLATYLYDILAYDAGTLYRIRNRAGQVVGLRPIDGTMIAPLQDYWGNVPAYPAEAYVQYANGLPWNWLTTRDLIYRPFRKRNNSPYGQAPLETILLNANTDLRFQAFFLQRFTQGNIPAAFASAPETWSPQQIEQFQEYWDAFVLGDQAVKSQIKWIPSGSRIEFTNEHEFSDAFSLFLMRKTLGAYHVVPSDVGFTETVNKSSGETQSDVQHRIGDVPLAKHVSSVLTRFLQDDLHLPLKHQFDFGEEQDDRYQTAQADRIYWEIGAIGSSEIRQMRFGLTDPQPVPRTVFTTRSGPVPIAALDAVAGPIDAGTGLPERRAALPHQAFRPIEGVNPEPPLESPPLAEQIYGPDAVADPQNIGTLDQLAVKEAGPGITAATGITSYDLVGHNRDEDDDENGPVNLTPAPTIAKAAEVRAAELAAFRRHAKQCRRPGRWWRDFEFTAVGPVEAHRLNDAGRLAVRKADGQIAVAGLAVYAQDTGRVLMLQRALDDEDPAAGTWEFPGGHVETGETPSQAAAREWSEETGIHLPDGRFTGQWDANDIYQGFVYTVASEEDVPIDDGREAVKNPNGDYFEALAWWDPSQLPGNPAVRTELADGIDDVMAALGVELAKAGGDRRRPKAPAGPADHWPGWHHDHRAANHWAPKISTALTDAVPDAAAQRIAAGYLDAHPEAQDKNADRKVLIAAAVAYLTAQHLNLEPPLTDLLGGLLADGYLIGLASAVAVLDDKPADLGGWKPGDTASATDRIGQLGAALALAALVGTAQAAARNMAATRLDDMARKLADAAMRGDGSTEAGRALRAALADASRAAAAAVTEITRASSAGAFATYAQRGVTLGRWVTEGDTKVCPRCTQNATAGPVPIGQPYPSSDVNAPAHTRCRCAVIPA